MPLTPTDKRSSFTKIPDEIKSGKLKGIDNESDEYVSIKLYSKDLESLLKVMNLS